MSASTSATPNVRFARLSILTVTPKKVDSKFRASTRRGVDRYLTLSAESVIG